MRQALELAWESCRAGSLGIGAVVTHDGRALFTGRNRMGESDPGDDLLAGSTLAHAEMNVLAKIPWRTPGDGLELWTTLQPCLQCLGAIRLSPVPRVHVLAPDPLFRGVERARDLSPFIGQRWPTITERPVDEATVLSLLLPVHHTVLWDITPVLVNWEAAVPTLVGLGRDLVATHELTELAAAGTSLDDLAATLHDRLAGCLPEIVRLAAVDPPGAQ
jgi:tRNA(Arg) A34 adenosine deaminase TadA